MISLRITNVNQTSIKRQSFTRPDNFLLLQHLTIQQFLTVVIEHDLSTDQQARKEKLMLEQQENLDHPRLNPASDE